MRTQLTTYYTDGTIGITEIEIDAGHGPDSIGMLARGLMKAEKCGKKVLKIGRSKVNPLSKPGVTPLDIDDGGALTREHILETLKLFKQPMSEEYKPLFG